MRKSRARALITLFTHLEHMEKAGVPLRQSLEAARTDADDSGLRRVLSWMAEDVRAGSKLSEAMAAHGAFFDPVTVRLIAAGEKAGRLTQVFTVCGAHVAQAAQYARKMASAMRYPKIAGLIIIGLALLRGHSTMPYIAAYVVGGALLFAAARRYIAPFRNVTDYLLLYIPVVGRLVLADSWARFAEALAMLYDAGVPLRDALSTAAECVPNAAIRESAQAAVPLVGGGLSLHDAVARAGRADRMTLTMLRTGERSGNLGHTLREVSSWHDKESDNAMTALHQTAGPVLTIILGAMVYFGL